MKDLLGRSLQTTIIFLIVGGVLALAFGGYLGTASRGLGSSLVSIQTWVATRYAAIQDFFAAPRDITALRQRNAELEAEVSRLQGQVIDLQQKVSEAEILAEDKYYHTNQELLFPLLDYLCAQIS